MLVLCGLLGFWVSGIMGFSCVCLSSGGPLQQAPTGFVLLVSPWFVCVYVCVYVYVCVCVCSCGKESSYFTMQTHNIDLN